MTDNDDWGEPQSGGDIWDLKDQGPLIGTYVGYREINGDYGISKLHEFTTDEGRKAVWGKAHLDRLLDGRAGELVKVVLTGNTIKLGGGRTMVEYQLFSKGRQGPVLPQAPLPAPESASNGGGAAEAAPFPGAS